MVRHTLWLSWWTLMVAALFAILLTAVRLAFPLLGDYRTDVAAQLSQYLGVEVTIGELKTGWRGPYPTFEFKDIHSDIDYLKPKQLEFNLQNISFELDPWRSLIDAAPIFQRVSATGLNVKLRQTEGRWLASLNQSKADNRAIDTLIAILFEQPSIQFSESQLQLIPESGRSRFINLDNMSLESSETEHQLSGSFWMPVLGQDSRMRFAIQHQGQSANGQLILPFYVELDNIGSELAELAGVKQRFSLTANARVWGQLRGTSLDYLVGDLSAKSLQLLLPNELGELALEELATNFSIQTVDRDYQLQLHDFSAIYQDREFTLPPTAIDFSSGVNGWMANRIQLSELNLSDLSALALNQPLGDKSSEIVQSLSPSGLVKGLTVDLSQGLEQLSVVGELSDVAIKSWRGSPAASQLNGLFYASSDRGWIDIDSQQLVMEFPTVYDWALPFNFAQGRVHWQLHNEYAAVGSDLLELGLNNIRTRGQFSIDLPYDKELQALLNLSMGLKGAIAREALLLTPPKVVGEGLYNWLNRALVQGDVKEAGLVLVTPTRPVADRPKPLSELYIAVENTALDYQSPWPVLNRAEAVIHARDGSARVQLEQGSAADTEIGFADLWMESGSGQLETLLAVEGSAFDLNALFHSEALANSIGNKLGDWQLSGGHKSLVDLQVPLKGGSPKLTVQSALNRGVFISESQRIAVTDIDGTVNFDLENGLSAEGLAASFLGRIFDVDVSSDQVATDVNIAGRIDSHRLMQWAGIPLSGVISGDIPLNSTVKLCAKECQSTLKVESQLTGTHVDAPAYLAHQSSDISRLSLLMTLQSSPTLQLNYADRLKAHLNLGSPLTGNIRLGGNKASYKITDRLHIDGSLPSVEVEELLGFIDALSESKSDTAEGLSVTSAIEIGQLNIGTLIFESLLAEVSNPDRRWSIALDGRDIQGVIDYNLADASMDFNLRHLHLRTPDSDPSIIEPEVPLPDPTPIEVVNKIPSTSLLIENLVWNDDQWGRWKANLLPSGNSLLVDQLEADIAGISLTGQGIWSVGEVEQSRLSLSANGMNLADFLESMGDPRAVETKSLSAEFALRWPGAPWSFSRYRLGGDLQFDLRNGQITEAKGSSALLRLFGILNFNNLFKRLRLDFTDLYKSGITFDKLVGKYHLEDGIAKTQEPLIMRGASADLTAEGSLNLINRTVDKRVDVILPLTGNTPLAAVLLGAPQVAGALFLIDKLIGDKINEATKLSYTMTGPWREPLLEIINGKDR